MVVLNNELVDGDSLADLNIELSIDSARVDMESSFNSATSYKVNAEGYSASKNYNVTVFGSGVYTIMPLNIYITVEAGGGVYQGQINPVKLTGVYAADDNRNILEEFAPEVAPKFALIIGEALMMEIGLILMQICGLLSQCLLVIIMQLL